MIDYQQFQKLRNARNSAKRKYEYAIRDLNKAMHEFNYAQKQDDTGTHEEPTEDSKLSFTTIAVDGFLNLVEAAKNYYDSKAEYERLDKEYFRQGKIIELVDSIDNYIRWITNANYTDYNESLEKDFDELCNHIQ